MKPLLIKRLAIVIMLCNSIENTEGDNLNVLQETKTGLRQDGDSNAHEINSKCLNDSREMDIDSSKVKDKIRKMERV